MNKNIKTAMDILAQLRKKYPELNRTELALKLTGGYHSDLYNVIALLLNEAE